MHALSRDQSGRPQQPNLPMSAAEVAACATLLEGWASGLGATHGTPVLLTYMTDTRPPWALGLSAAHFKIPLVVAGHGMRWGGVGIKLPAIHRAIQMLSALLPQYPVIFADGSDTVVGNPLGLLVTKHVASALMGRSISGSSNSRLIANLSVDSVLLSGECGSYPLCYREAHERMPAFLECRTRSSTCYPSSGMYMGSPEALMRLLPIVHNISQHGGGVEHNEDQAAANLLYSSSASPRVEHAQLLREGRLSLVIDDESDVFLSLYGCKFGKTRTIGHGLWLCHEGAYDPLQHISRDGNSILHTDRAGRAHRPFLVHASGIHDRLLKAFGNRTNWYDIFARDVVVDRHPVVVVDSATQGVCNLTTLGALSPVSRLSRGHV